VGTMFDHFVILIGQELQESLTEQWFACKYLAFALELGPLQIFLVS
jgi:hypothetical protein